MGGRSEEWGDVLDCMTVGSDARYSKEEVALILRRAAEIQDQKLSEEKSGLSLNELEAAAREAGVDPALVRRAAVELPRVTRSEPSFWSRLAGQPMETTYHKTVTQRVESGQMDAMVARLQNMTGMMGQCSYQSDGLRWTASPDASRPFVLLLQPLASLDMRQRSDALTLKASRDIRPQTYATGFLSFVAMGLFSFLAATAGARFAGIGGALVGVLLVSVACVWVWRQYLSLMARSGDKLAQHLLEALLEGLPRPQADQAELAAGELASGESSTST